jgi:flagellar basal-body rod protein FlgF
MSHDLYTSWSGAHAAWQQLELISSNVANAHTSGFREQRGAFELRGSTEPLGATRAALGEVAYNQADASLEMDGVSTHLAVRGDGFFALADGTFTRDGRFQLDQDGRLVTSSGVYVLVDGGPVQLAPGETLSVDAKGMMAGSVSGPLGQLQIVRLQDGSPLGGNAWSGTATPTTEATVVQGAVEGSNVDPLKAMIEMVGASRHFEVMERAMRTSDDMTARCIRMME